MENITELFTGIGFGFYGLFVLYDFLKNRIKLPPNNRHDFLSHPFFKVMNDGIEYLIPSIKIPNDPIKTNITQMYAIVKLSVFRDAMFDIVRKFKHGGGKHMMTKKELLKGFDQTIKLYRREAIKSIASVYNRKIAEMFDKKFTFEVHMACITSTKDSMASICDSQFYCSCGEKLAAILDILTFAFHHTIIDLERTCAELNGSLTKELKKLGYESHYPEYVTREEFELTEKTQDMMLHELNHKKK